MNIEKKLINQNNFRIFTLFFYFSPCRRPCPLLTLSQQYFVPSMVINGQEILDKKQKKTLLTDNDQSLH